MKTISMICVICLAIIFTPFLGEASRLDEQIEFESEIQYLFALQACLVPLHIDIPENDFIGYVEFHYNKCSKPVQMFLDSQSKDYMDYLASVGIQRMMDSGSFREVCPKLVVQMYNDFKKAGINATYLLKAAKMFDK